MLEKQRHKHGVRSRGRATPASTDGTAGLVEVATREQPAIRLLRLTHKGKGWAVKNGMLEARGQHRFLADADLSMPIELLERFLSPELKGFDVVIGSREAPGARRFDEPVPRHLQGRVFNWLVRLLAVRGFSDTQCGFKYFTSQAAETLFPLQRAVGFGFDVEVLFIAKKMGMNIVEVPVDWYYQHGSKVRPLKDSFLMVRDILYVRLNSLIGKYKGISSRIEGPHSTGDEGSDRNTRPG